MSRLLECLHTAARLLRGWGRDVSHLGLTELAPDVILLGTGRDGEALCRVLVECHDLGNGLRVSGLLLARNAGVLQELLPLLWQTLDEERSCQHSKSQGILLGQHALTVNSPVLELKPTWVR